MSYDFKWIDEDRRILQVTAFDPITESDVKTLIGEMRSLTDSPTPFFLMVDLRQYDIRKALSFGNLIQSEPFPTQSPALMKSRIAVVGGGTMIKMVLQMMQGMGPVDLIRPFDKEADALRWLDEEARLAGV